MATQHYRTIRAYEPSSSRYAGFVFVVVFHVLLAYFLVKTLAERKVESIPQDVQVAKVEELKKKDEAPPPPPPDLNTPPPPPYIPPVEINIATAPPPTNAIQQVTHNVAPPAPPPPPPAPSQVLPPRSDPAHKINTDSCYPPISKRLGEEGVVGLQVLVGADGRVMDTKVGKSSGFSRLDAAASECIKAQGRFIPGSADGKPAEAWANVPVRFELR
jgi:protein TonB